MFVGLIIGICIAAPLPGARASYGAEQRPDATDGLGVIIEGRLQVEAKLVAARDRLLANTDDPNRVAIIQRNVQRWLDYPTLELFETRNTDDALAAVNSLPFFAPKMIGLYSSDVTDRGLRYVAAEDELEFFGLRFCAGITDEGIAQLVSLPALKRLDLWNTPITDSSIDHLARMSQLRTLRIADTKITASGVRRLRSALPYCEIDAE